MRAGRLLQLLLLLQTRGRMTAQELADELEVSVRTVYRDVDALSAAGVPVYADRGPAGGYQLVAGYRTRLTGLTGEEAESLFLAGMPGPAAELGLGTVVAAAQLKVLAALPPELRSRAGRIRERFHLDAAGWFRQTEDMPFLAVIADAVWNVRLVRVRYRRWGNEVVERVVGPLGLVLKAGLWYLVAASDGSDGSGGSGGSDGQPRTYRVSRVEACEVVDGTFDRPEGFDLTGFWGEWSKRFEERMYPVRVTVKLTEVGLRTARVLLSLAASRALEDVVAEGEWTTVEIPTESLDHALFDLLRLGPEVEVVAPLELRQRMGERARATAALYAGEDL